MWKKFLVWLLKALAQAAAEEAAKAGTPVPPTGLPKPPTPPGGGS